MPTERNKESFPKSFLARPSASHNPPHEDGTISHKNKEGNQGERDRRPARVGLPVFPQGPYLSSSVGDIAEPKRLYKKSSSQLIEDVMRRESYLRASVRKKSGNAWDVDSKILQEDVSEVIDVEENKSSNASRMKRRRIAPISNEVSNADVHRERNDYLPGGFPMPKIEYPLAGPFVRDLITENPKAWEALEGSKSESIQQATSKILVLMSRFQNSEQERNNQLLSSSEHESSINETHDTSQNKCAIPTIEKNQKGHKSKTHEQQIFITVPMGLIETIAGEFVSDRHKLASQAVKQAFIEMKKNHDHIFSKTSGFFASQIATMSHEYNAELERVSSSNKDIEFFLKDKHDNELNALKVEHERYVELITKAHRDKMMELYDGMGLERRGHSRALNAYVAASCNALHLLKKGTDDEPK